jgi:hypothetical protein
MYEMKFVVFQQDGGIQPPEYIVITHMITVAGKFLIPKFPTYLNSKNSGIPLHPKTA